MSQRCRDNMPKSVKLSKFTIETFEDIFILEENDFSVEFIRIGGHSYGFSVAYFPSQAIN